MIRHSFFTALALTGALVQGLAAQDRRNEQFYFPGAFNWQFLERYPEGGRLFNAFDYGHAVLYEQLYTHPRDLVNELEVRQFDFLTTDLLVRPPRFAVAEEAIEPAYAKLAWRAKMMFDWAHLLHRQIYDIYADPRLSRTAQDSLIERVTDYYLSNRRLAFSSVPKAMTLMDEQYFSQTFRRHYPKFNGLIWAYHWLQVGLYEPLIQGRTVPERKAGVQAAIARFWSMVGDPPSRFPKVMPMTPVVAPQFTAVHPRAAIIFDNLHMTHDIISDILASDSVPMDRKRATIYRALDQMQDSTLDVMSRDEWLNMGDMMGGVAAMGGLATDLLPALASITAAAPTMAGMGHDTPAPMDSAAAAHAMMPMGHDSTTMAVPAAMPDSARQDQIQRTMALYSRMMADPVIRQRIISDSSLSRLVRELVAPVPPGHQTEMPQMVAPLDRKPLPRRIRPRPARVDSMPGMGHPARPGMSMPHDTTHH